MAGQTTAVLAAKLEAIEATCKDIKDAHGKHVQSDKEEFESIREVSRETERSISELKVMIAENLAVQADVGSIRKDVDSLKLTRAGNKPWMDMLIKLLWAVFGAGAAWLITHGGSLGQ